jgi:diguanylate cyclase
VWPQNLESFEQAGQAILSFLHQRLDFDLWMITRIEGDDWIVLQSEDHGYGIKPGQVFRWADSFCSHIVKGNAPCIAPRSADIKLYNVSPVIRQFEIQAYIGYPLVKADGQLFGMLYAIDPAPKHTDLWKEEGLIVLLADLLSTILQNELKQVQHERQLERLKVETLTDELTRLYNRRGWERLLAAEEERSRRHRYCSAIYVIDLDGLKEVNDSQGHSAGDKLIRKAAQTLQQAVRVEDVVARLGGDEFAILTVEVNQHKAGQLAERLKQALQKAGVDASIGYALRHPSTDLEQTLIKADQQMYVHKRYKK